MMRNLKRTLKNRRGQIGQILVVLVLIILAVLGVVRYIMPMFNKGGDMTATSSSAIDEINTTMRAESMGTLGQIVPGNSVISYINKNASNPNILITTVNGTAVTTAPAVATASTCPLTTGSTATTIYYKGVSNSPKYYENYWVNNDASNIGRVNVMANYKVTAISYGTNNMVDSIVYSIID